MGGKITDAEDQGNSDACGCGGLYLYMQKAPVYGCAEDSCHRVDPFLLNDGDFTDHHIPQNTAADTRDGTDENGQKGIVAVSGFYSGVHAYNDIDGETDGVEYIEQLFISLLVMLQTTAEKVF